METPSAANLGKICRTCLLESPKMVSLTTKMVDGKRTVNDVLLFVLNDNVTVGPRFPQQVCGDCESLLCKLDEFKQRCHDSERVLKEVLNVTELDSIQSVKLENASKVDKQPSVEHYIELNPVNAMLSIKEDTNHEVEDTKKDTKVGVKNSIKLEFGDDSDSLNEAFDDDDNDDNIESFTCPCKKTFTDSKAYQSHLNSKDCVKTSSTNDLLSIPVKCERCNIVFKNTKAFKIHARIHSKSSRVYSKCIHCARTFKKKSSLQVHLDNKICLKPPKAIVKKVKTEKVKKERKERPKNKALLMPVKCEPCNKIFKTMKLYRIHSRRHKTDELDECYQCSLCTRKFKKKSSLAQHLKNHEERDNIKFTCEICKREFKYQAHLDNHIAYEHNSKKNLTLLQIFPLQEPKQEPVATEKKHSCTHCSKSFNMMSTLTDHMRTHTGERPFLCSVCGRGFTQKTNLAQHMRRHLGLKPFKCADCERRFVSKGELDAHARKHTGAHPFVCDECGNGFTTSSSLRKHKRVHTGERPYACDLCPMKFAVSGTLKSHRRTHTGEKPYQCSYCEKAFVQRQDLVSHIRCHTGERPFVCATCGQAFRKPSALKAHVKTHKLTTQPAPPHMLGGLQPLSLLQPLHGMQGNS